MADATPQEIGTLIAVILKAKNLPNKRQFGKQDPYCSIVMNGETQRTKAVKRGGQHPEFDEEVRFTLYEDIEDILQRTAHSDNVPPPLPPKGEKNEKKIKGGKSMRVYAYADDSKEPDLIGEAVVDLTEVLTKGETDEWFTLMHKEKYCGEVYLELTFWSNEAPPEKKKTPVPNKNGKLYGGPGSFVPLDEGPSSLLSHPPVPRNASMSGPYRSHRHDSLPSTLRASNSAQVDLHGAPYDQHGYGHPLSSIHQLTNDFGELGVAQRFAPSQGGYASPAAYSSLPSHGRDLSDSGSTFSSYEALPPSSSRPLPHRNTISGGYQSHGYLNEGDRPYRSASAYVAPPSSNRAPRHSIPTSSSGFMPLSAPMSSGFVAMSSHPSESALIPQPTGYATGQFQGHPGYSQSPHPLSQPGTPSSYIPTSSFPQSQYSHYPPQYSHIPTQPTGYEGYNGAVQGYEQSVPGPANNTLPPGQGSGRPLPPQPPFAPPLLPPQAPYGASPSAIQHMIYHEQGPGPAYGSQPSLFPANSYSHIPPPPHLPPSVYQGIPPPPPIDSPDRGSLPQPPVNYQQPPTRFIPPGPPPTISPHHFDVGPPPRPPSQPNEHGHWPQQQGYTAPGGYPN